jgi:hypothetical protein
MCRYLFFFLFITLFFCQCRESDNSLLARARVLINGDMKRACFVLDSIRQPEKFSIENLADYNYMKAICSLSFETEWEVADSLNNRALNYYKKSGDTINLCKALYFSSYIFTRTENVDSIINRSQRGIEFEESNYLNHYLLHYYRIIMNAYTNKSDFENALFYSSKSLTLEPENNPNIISLYKRHAQLLDKLDRMEESFSFYEKALASAKDQNEDRSSSVIFQDIADFFLRQGDYKDALHYINESIENRANRKDVASFFLTKGLIFKSMEEPDSARVYFQKALNSSQDQYKTLLAHKELSALYSYGSAYEQAYYQIISYKNGVDNIESRIENESLTWKFNEVVLENENNQLRLAKNRQEIYILLTTMLFIIILSILIFILFRERKKKEIKEKEQVNLQLRQENELMVLQEKASTLRESLFRKMSVSQKIPSLDGEKRIIDGTEKQRIRIEEKDWNELVHTTDNLFNGFVSRLEKDCPELSHEDIRFCCLIKIKVSMQDLADIYCISKAGVTKRKTRMKKEKFNITKESVSLDEFLMNF